MLLLAITMIVCTLLLIERIVLTDILKREFDFDLRLSKASTITPFRIKGNTNKFLLVKKS